MRTKKIRHLTVSLVATLLVGVSTFFVLDQPSSVQAQASTQANDSINQTEPVRGSFLGAGSTIQVTDNVDGDVYAAGQTVNITGKITGDVLVLGQNVTISGDITGDVRVVAMSATITGNVTGSLSAAVQNLSITDSATIGRDAVLASQSAVIDGKVKRDVLAAVEKLSVSGSVGRDVNYVSDQEISRSATASIAGKVSRTEASSQEPSSRSTLLSSFVFTALAIGFAVLVASLIMPRWLNSATNAAFPQPWKVMLAGVLTLAIPFVAVLLMVSFIGLYAGLIIMLAYMLLLLLGVIFVSYYIGRLILRNQQHMLVQGLVGALIFTVLLFVPVVSVFAWIFGGWIGIGIIVLDIAKRISRQYPTKKQARLATRKTTNNK